MPEREGRQAGVSTASRPPSPPSGTSGTPDVAGGGDMAIHDLRPGQGPAVSAGAQAQFGVVVVGAGMTAAMIGVSALLTVSTSRNGGSLDVGVGVAAFLLFLA